MATTHQDTNVNQLVINKMTKQEYDNLSQVSETELYLVEEQVDSVVTQGSTNPVQSGAVYEALQQSSSNIKDGTTTFTKNNETIGTTSANQSVNQTIALPNDVMMCKMLENKALASYATPITRFKYIEDHGWVDMDRSDIQYNEGTGEWTGTFVSLDITEGEYYYDMDNEAVFVADENSEMQDVTSTVVIQGDTNKLYCNVGDNKLYRYDGSNFVALTSNFSGDYNDLINKPNLNFLKQRDLTTYQGENDEIVQHIGATSGNLVNCYVYKNTRIPTITLESDMYGAIAGTYTYDKTIFLSLELRGFLDRTSGVWWFNKQSPAYLRVDDVVWQLDNNDNIVEIATITEIDDVDGGYSDCTLSNGKNCSMYSPETKTFSGTASVFKFGNNYQIFKLGNAYGIVDNQTYTIFPLNNSIQDGYINIWQLHNTQPNQLSVEGSKVKYKLSDGTTKLTLAQESDLAAIAFSGKSIDGYDYYKYKSDYKDGIIIADITAIMTSSSTGNKYQGFNGTVIFSRQVGYIYDCCAQITCSISYSSNERRLYTNNKQIRPQIRSYNNKYYLCISTETISGGYLYFYGKGRDLLSAFLEFDASSYTLVQDCYNTTNNAEIVFPSSAVSGNIASGETLAVMMKKIAQNSEDWGIGSVADIELHKGFTNPHSFACTKSFSIGTAGGSVTLGGSTKGILISIGGDIVMLAIETNGALISAYIDPNNHWQAAKKFQ